MARNVSVDRSQSEQSQGQGRSLSRHDDYYFPSLSGDLFSLSPFALLREMTDWMDRSYTGSPSRGAGASQMWAPALEVRKKDNNLVVCADLPGIDSKDVKVEVDNDTLIIQGERKHEHAEDKEGWHRSERTYGNFYRAIPLPEGAKSDQAKADFRNGVLEITIPVEEPKSNRRQIQIQGGTSGTGNKPAA